MFLQAFLQVGHGSVGRQTKRHQFAFEFPLREHVYLFCHQSRWCCCNRTLSALSCKKKGGVVFINSARQSKPVSTPICHGLRPGTYLLLVSAGDPVQPTVVQAIQHEGQCCICCWRDTPAQGAVRVRGPRGAHPGF